MKTLGIVIILATAIAVIYGVFFALAYPLVEVHSGIVSLVAIAGLLTSLGIIGIYNWFTESKSAIANVDEKKQSARRKKRRH